MYKTIAAICAALMVSACHVRPGIHADRKAANLDRPGRDGSWYPAFRDYQSGSGVEIVPLSEPRVAGLDLLQDESSLLSKRSVYYANDAYTIETLYQEVIEAHAQFLHEHPDLKLRIEGNCDERGSTEYNLALGQRRADMVKRALVMLGADAGQITAISLGSQRPKALGHSEAERSQNRRSDLLYVGVDTRR
jgi:peptidoglycan-associated lipoprotein